MAKSEVTLMVFNAAPARGVLAWPKLMRRKVSKSQLHFIKTVSIYINLTQTVTNTGNVPSFHSRARRGYASAANVGYSQTKRRGCTQRGQYAAGALRNRRHASATSRLYESLLLRAASASTISVCRPLGPQLNEYLIKPISTQSRRINERTLSPHRQTCDTTFVDIPLIDKKFDLQCL